MDKMKLRGLLVMAYGSIIGSGIFAMIGVGITFTGKSISLALLIGSILNVIRYAPFILVSGSTKIKGGGYGIAKVLIGRYAAVYGLNALFINFMSSIYCIAIVEYMSQYLGFMQTNVKLYQVIVLSLFFLVSYTGLKGMTKFQGVIVVMMFIAMFAFIGFGLGQVHSGYVSNDFFAGGLSGFIIATAALSFASAGGQTVANYYEVAEKPGRKIPLTIIVATLTVGILYLVVGVVASGVLPISQVQGKMLNVVAAEILPSGVLFIFIIGGAVAALASTVNNGLAYIKYPVQALARDTYLPKWMIRTDKNGYMFILMGIFYIAGLIPIIVGLNIEEIVSISLGPVYITNAVLCFRTSKLDRILGEQWEKSSFYMSKSKLMALSIIAGVIQLVLGIILITSFSTTAMIASGLLGLASLIYVSYVNRAKSTNKNGGSYES